MHFLRGKANKTNWGEKANDTPLTRNWTQDLLFPCKKAKYGLKMKMAYWHFTDYVPTLNVLSVIHRPQTHIVVQTHYHGSDSLIAQQVFDVQQRTKAPPHIQHCAYTWWNCTIRAGQNCADTPYLTVYLVISLPKTTYTVLISPRTANVFHPLAECQEQFK